MSEDRKVPRFSIPEENGTGTQANVPPRPGDAYVEARRLTDRSPPGVPIFPPEISAALQIKDTTPGGPGSAQAHLAPREQALNKDFPIRDSTGQCVGDMRSGLMPSDVAQRAVDSAFPIVPAAKSTKRTKT